MVTVQRANEIIEQRVKDHVARQFGPIALQILDLQTRSDKALAERERLLKPQERKTAGELITERAAIVATEQGLTLAQAFVSVFDSDADLRRRYMAERDAQG